MFELATPLTQPLKILGTSDLDVVGPPFDQAW